MIIIKIWDYCYVNELETVQEVNIAIAIETPKQYYDMMNISERARARALPECKNLWDIHMRKRWQ